jgi:hypothetical protein
MAMWQWKAPDRREARLDRLDWETGRLPAPLKAALILTAFQGLSQRRPPPNSASR